MYKRNSFEPVTEDASETSNDFWDDIEDNIPEKNNKKQEREKLYKKYSGLIKKFDCSEKNKVKNDRVNTDSAHRCELLYEHAKARRKYLKEIRKEIEATKNNKEISECTFQPNLNVRKMKKNSSKAESKNLSVKETNSGLTMYERNQRWLANKQENLIKAKRRYSDDLRNTYNYKPTINRISSEYINTVFNEENNIINQPENYYYLVRQYRARENSKNQKEEPRKDRSYYLSTSHYSQNSSKKVNKSEMREFKTNMHQEILNL